MNLAISYDATKGSCGSVKVGKKINLLPIWRKDNWETIEKEVYEPETKVLLILMAVSFGICTAVGFAVLAIMVVYELKHSSIAPLQFLVVLSIFIFNLSKLLC